MLLLSVGVYWKGAPNEAKSTQERDHSREQLNSMSFCSNAKESLEHLLFTCSFSSQIWNQCYRGLRFLTMLLEDDRMHFLQHGSELREKQQRRRALSVWLKVTWFIWKQQNQIVLTRDIWMLCKCLIWSKCVP